MRNTILAAAAAFSMALASGAAYAQQQEGETDMQGPLPGLETFHSDPSMTELRTPDEMRASFGALSAEEQQALRDRCQQASVAMDTDTTSEGVDDQTTASTTNDYPETFADLCREVNAW